MNILQEHCFVGLFGLDEGKATPFSIYHSEPFHMLLPFLLGLCCDILDTALGDLVNLYTWNFIYLTSLMGMGAREGEKNVMSFVVGLPEPFNMLLPFQCYHFNCDILYT